MRNGPYWTLYYLLNTNEVLVLILLSIELWYNEGGGGGGNPISKREKEGNNGYGQVLQKHQSHSLPPIEASHDNFGVFKQSFMK
jgi:hypothetical protein